ncbi:hypothetical protein AXG93_4324s1070 [Marchantia polymorpha subsp. ruderalis]|uniref:Uncharacterized protein n=1 Tax=Marchantia polymorpha subsp. ruderalis TaxID=1480154 RepID=A0A176W1A7_MARPO|nr:hypothetical protein AXG93_4324s1070 [Marchantia polymorpha subsp. ruderalis]
MSSPDDERKRGGQRRADSEIKSGERVVQLRSFSRCDETSRCARLRKFRAPGADIGRLRAIEIARPGLHSGRTRRADAGGIVRPLSQAQVSSKSKIPSPDAYRLLDSPCSAQGALGTLGAVVVRNRAHSIADSCILRLSETHCRLKWLALDDCEYRRFAARGWRERTREGSEWDVGRDRKLTLMLQHKSAHVQHTERRESIRPLLTGRQRRTMDADSRVASERRCQILSVSKRPGDGSLMRKGDGDGELSPGHGSGSHS